MKVKSNSSVPDPLIPNCLPGVTGWLWVSSYKMGAYLLQAALTMTHPMFLSVYTVF